MTFIPSALVTLRFLIAPFLLWDAVDEKTTIWFIVAFVVAFLSDIFDGIIAHRLGVSNAKLRQADGWADITLYAFVAISAWFVHREAVISCRLPLLALAIAQILWWIVNLAKYGKPASYHTYSAKFWGLTLFVAVVSLFSFNYAGIPLWISCIAGIIHSFEEIAMTFILPIWTHDVLSIFHAIKVRDEILVANG
jgi:CDP-diacylglycerol--glycerol-3-phosphate 3-phosphatidyltransferase